MLTKGPLTPVKEGPTPWAKKKLQRTPLKAGALSIFGITYLPTIFIYHIDWGENSLPGDAGMGALGDGRGNNCLATGF